MRADFRRKTATSAPAARGPAGLFAPISCYTCPKFQPWKGTTHREVLDWLCAVGHENQDGRHQIVGIHDSTILAVAEVVLVCEGAPS